MQSPVHYWLALHCRGGDDHRLNSGTIIGQSVYIEGNVVSNSHIDELVNCEGAQSTMVPANQTLFSLGDECKHFVFVRSGQVRVELLSTSGQQMVLYRIHDGESCVMTTACLLGNNHYFAQALSETQVDLILIPHAIFRSRLNSSADFRDYVFDGFSARLSALMQRTTELATWTVDQRIASVLSHLMQSHGSPVNLTHDQLALEIGSAREVVSRRLAVFEKQGIVAKQRGQIDILDAGKLNQLLAQ